MSETWTGDIPPFFRKWIDGLQTTIDAQAAELREARDIIGHFAFVRRFSEDGKWAKAWLAAHPDEGEGAARD